ncbi:MAG: RDD family protein, partial [Kangiellaceae bacterium]|nr:RDD family protein [Kangiellaceae bacterium]
QTLQAHPLSESLMNNPLWVIYLAACVQYYYAWCWVKGGQTVGMRAWRIKICKPDGNAISWKEAYIRTFASLGGISSVWSIADKEKRGLQDIACDSRVVVLPKDFHKKEDKPLI